MNSVRLNDLEPQKKQIREPAEGQHRQSSDNRGGIQDHLTGFSAAKKDLRDEGKEKRLSLAWTAVIAAVATIMNIVLLYVLTGNLEDLQSELSLKLESLKDKIQYQSESKSAQSDEVPRAMLQGSDTNDKNKIDCLIFCTQTPDYYMPATACVLQERLGLGKNTGAFDINLGCSGFVYGLAISKGFIAVGGFDAESQEPSLQGPPRPAPRP